MDLAGKTEMEISVGESAEKSAMKSTGKSEIKEKYSESI